MISCGSVEGKLAQRLREASARVTFRQFRERRGHGAGGYLGRTNGGADIGETVDLAGHWPATATALVQISCG